MTFARIFKSKKYEEKKPKSLKSYEPIKSEETKIEDINIKEQQSKPCKDNNLPRRTT